MPVASEGNAGQVVQKYNRPSRKGGAFFGCRGRTTKQTCISRITPSVFITLPCTAFLPVPSKGFEPLRLAALAPKASVSASFTKRAELRCRYSIYVNLETARRAEEISE